MPSINLRRYNRVALAAELAGFTWFAGRPCKANPNHVDADGTPPRDTVRKTCNRCDLRKVEAWRERAGSCAST